MARKKENTISESQEEFHAIPGRHWRNRDIPERFGTSLLAFPVAFLGMFGLFIYSKNWNPWVLVFAFLVIVVTIGLRPLFDFLKAAAVKGIEQESLKVGDWKKSMDRIENLEAIICRLDTEINSQLEHTLSAGKITTLESAGNSQIPTVFLNISSALEKRFQLLKELGRGGMGIVFQAHDKQLKEQVAIKVLSPLLSNNADALERLKREVSAARRITHPNVIRIHDISESEGLHFVSMEYFPGTTLRELIKLDGPCSLSKGAQLTFQICDGLESAHRQAVIHRDLKSQNIIVNDLGELKIIDFGLASCSHQEGMTATGLILGTPEYMAPEQVSGKKADERADIYAFGIILYELFTGKVPFTGDSPIAVGFQQLNEQPVKPADVNPKIPAAIESIILKALRKDPAQRFASVSEMRVELEEAFHRPGSIPSKTERNIQAVPETTISRRNV